MQPVLLHNVNVIDGTGTDLQSGLDILISEGHISAMGPKGSLPIHCPATQVYALDGMTVLPGLIDCHVHVFADAGPEGRLASSELPGFALLRAAYHARRTLEAGITTVRDCGGLSHQGDALPPALSPGGCPGARPTLAGQLAPMTFSAGHGVFGADRQEPGDV